MGGALPAGLHVLNAGLAGAITEGSPTNPVPEAGNNTARGITTISENAAVLGAVRPANRYLAHHREIRFGYNEQSFTRIDPRQLQTYKIHANYKPKPWATSGWRASKSTKTATTSRPWPTWSTTACTASLPCSGASRAPVRGFRVQLLGRVHPVADLLHVLDDFGESHAATYQHHRCPRFRRGCPNSTGPACPITGRLRRSERSQPTAARIISLTRE